MIDYYLKFASKQEAETVLTKLNILVKVVEEDSTEYLPASSFVSIDFVGTIYKPTGVTLKSEDGMEYPEMKALDGYHVNLRFAGGLSIVYAFDVESGEYVEIPSTIPNDLAPYTVEPTTPSRVWA